MNTLSSSITRVQGPNIQWCRDVIKSWHKHNCHPSHWSIFHCIYHDLHSPITHYQNCKVHKLHDHLLQVQRSSILCNLSKTVLLLSRMIMGQFHNPHHFDVNYTCSSHYRLILQKDRLVAIYKLGSTQYYLVHLLLGRILMLYRKHRDLLAYRV